MARPRCTPRSTRLIPGALLVFCFAAGAAGQGGPTTFQVNFSNPGARSLGFGGAFVALADDATAAYANPAGLVQLARPELSIELRRWSYSTPFTEGGRLFGQPSGAGLDTTVGLRIGESPATLSGLSFLSAVYGGDDWSVALYGHQAAKFEASSETQGFFGDAPDGSIFRFNDIRKTDRFELDNYGVSAAVRPVETLSLGFGLSYYVGELLSTSEFYALTPDTLPEGALGPNAYDRRALLATSSASLDSAGWGVTGGFLWHLSEQWNLGGYYRSRPPLEFTGMEVSGPALDANVSDGTVLDSGTGSLDMPDALGAGVSYRESNGAITVSFEWDFVCYSSLIESLDPDIAGTQGITIPDAHEFHLGFEYAFLQMTPVIALRVGVWNEPDHHFSSRGNGVQTDAVLRPGGGELHVSSGAGVVLGQFQVDVGVDLSDITNTLSLSGIVSF